MSHLLHWTLTSLVLGGLLFPVAAAPREPAAAANPRVPPGVIVHADQVFVERAERALRLDLYVPGEAPRPLPLVIWVHGGAWRAGGKDNCPAVFLTRHGYAVASVEYRFSREAIWPAQIQDVKAAVRWLRGHAEEYGLDPLRFGAWGASAGGHLVAMLGTSGGVVDLDGGTFEESSRVQCVVDFFGPTDFSKMKDHPSTMDHEAADSPESRLVGAAIATVPERVRAANPMTYVDAGDPPFLIMHGDQDPLVPMNQSELLRDALEAAGVPVDFEVVEGAGHGFGGPAIEERVLAFLDSRLRGGGDLVVQRPVTTTPPTGEFLDPDDTAPPGLTAVRFPSAVLGTEASCLVYLPPGYADAPERRYPVVYWLHGLGGNQRTGAGWVRRVDAAIRAGTLPPLIAVLPNGLPAGFYTDSKDGRQPVESVLIRDLVPYVDATWRTIAERRGRGIEGFSMGGHGALKLAFGHPELFGAASSLAGAFHTAETLPRRRPEIFRTVFGDDAEYLRRNTVAYLAEVGAQRIGGQMRLRLVIGDQDPARVLGDALIERLEQLQIPVGVTVVPGAGHDYAALYDGLGDAALGFWAETFAR